MNIAMKLFCRIYQMGFRIAMPVLPYRRPKIRRDIADICQILETRKVKSVLLQKMARHAAAEANPLYPVPVLYNAKELERFYEMVADWEEEEDAKISE